MYIVFEGPDACGKSTQAAQLAEYLNQKGVPTRLSKEPGSPHNEVCLQLRKTIFHPDITEEAALFAFLADRSQHTRSVIAPALQDHKTVVSDRGTLSTIMYHVANSAQWPHKPHDWDYVGDLFPMLDLAQYIQPDLCFIVSADPDWCMQQLQARASMDRIEQKGIDFQRKLHNLFQAIADAPYTQGINDARHLANILRKHLKLFPKTVITLPAAHLHTTKEIHNFVVDRYHENLHS